MMLGEAIRQRILQEVHERPGIHKSALGRGLGVAFGTVHHHVRHLEDAGWIESRDDGGRKRLYVLGEEDPVPAWMAGLSGERAPVVPGDRAERVPGVLAMLRGPQNDGEETRAAILKAVSNQPGIHVSELCRLLGLTRGNADYHVGLLDQSLCLLTHEYRGRVRLFPFDTPSQQMRALSALGNDTRMSVALLMQRGITAPREMASRLGVTVRSVQRQIACLREAGLLEPEAPALTEQARRLLLRLTDGEPAGPD